MEDSFLSLRSMVAIYIVSNVHAVVMRFSNAMDSRCKQISRNTVCMGVSLSISRSLTRMPFANALHATPGMSCRSPSRRSVVFAFGSRNFIDRHDL